VSHTHLGRSGMRTHCTKPQSELHTRTQSHTIADVARPLHSYSLRLMQPWRRSKGSCPVSEQTGKISALETLHQDAPLYSPSVSKHCLGNINCAGLRLLPAFNSKNTVETLGGQTTDKWRLEWLHHIETNYHC